MLTFWVVHFGDHNVAGGVMKLDGAAAYRNLMESISDAFSRVDIPEVIRLLDKRFGEKTYSLRSLFRDEQRRIVRIILSTTVAEAEAAYLQLYEHHAALMRFLSSLGTPMPREFTAAIEYAINSLLRRACGAEELDEERIRNLLREAQVGSVTLDRTTLEFLLRHKLEMLAKDFSAEPKDIERLKRLKHSLRIAKQMPFTVSLWSVQNEIYAIHTGLYPQLRKRARHGNTRAQEWVDGYLQLSELLAIRVV